MDCSGDVKSVNDLSSDERHMILKRSGVFEESDINFFVCEAHYKKLENKDFHKHPKCLHPHHDKEKTDRIKPSELNSSRMVELQMSKIIFEKDGLLIPYDGYVCSTCKNLVFGNYENPRKRKLKDESVYESPPSGSGLLLSGSEGSVKGSPGSDFKPNSQDVQTERQDNLSNLKVLNNLPKRHLSHDLRLTNPIAGLHPDTQNKILQEVADGFAAVINTTTGVKEDQINIWHRLKEGPYMEDRLQVPGSEKPDSLVRDFIIAYNKTKKSKKKTQVNRNDLVKFMNIQ